MLNHLIEAGCDDNQRTVFIAEDATAIVCRVEYKPDDDSVIGFSSVLVPGTGLPQLQRFPASSISTVKKYFDENEENKAKSVYALVAIPLNNLATPFVIAIFGTQNKFSYLNVLDR